METTTFVYQDADTVLGAEGTHCCYATKQKKQWFRKACYTPAATATQCVDIDSFLLQIHETRSEQVLVFQA